jgi:hypothetical protein
MGMEYSEQQECNRTNPESNSGTILELAVKAG